MTGEVPRGEIRERTPDTHVDLRKTTVNGRPALVAECAGECDAEIVVEGDDPDTYLVEEGDDPHAKGRYRNYFCGWDCI